MGLSEHKLKKWLSHELSCSLLWLSPLLFQSSLDLPQGSVGLTAIVPGSDEPLARVGDQTEATTGPVVRIVWRTKTARRERGVNLASVEGGQGERGLVEGKTHNVPSVHH